jgi:hypothetical protein
VEFPTMPLQGNRRTERVGLTLTSEEVAKIDDYGFARRIRARPEVIPVPGFANARSRSRGL